MKTPHPCTLCTCRCDCGEATGDDCAGCAMCHETEGCEPPEASAEGELRAAWEAARR